MTSRWANPINNNILRDKENNVLAGGSLEFYEAGTSTPLAVYSDSDLSVSLGSSLTADAFGLIADFHMAAGTEYKMIAKDSGGTTKWTRDEVFSLDSSVDTRLDSLETSVGALSGGTNSIRNSSCQKQRTDSNENTVTAPSISSSFQEGTVAGHFAKATNVSAGTITRGTSTGLTAGYYLDCAGVTTTNSASTVVAQFRVDPGDAGKFVNGDGIFSCQVYHDVGSAIDYTITLKKADAEDDFSSTTTIATSSTTSVNSGTWTAIEFSNAALGDCRNGLAIEVSAACGVQTTKNYWFGMPQMETGTSSTAWSGTPAENDFAGLQFKPRQYHAEFINTTCRISQDTDTDHDILVPSGSACRDSTDAFDIITSADITKQIDNAASPPASTGWQEGDNENGFPSGVNSGVPAANTWYYFFLIAKTDGTVDAGFDDNASATNLLADASTYTYYRIVGLVKTDGSSNITQVARPHSVIVETLTSGTSWTVPPLVYEVEATKIGGGGGGGGGADGANSGADGSAGGNTTFNGESASGGLGGTGSDVSQADDGVAATTGQAAANGGTGGSGDTSTGEADSGQDGRGGEIRISRHIVTPSASITCAIGAGGTGGSSSSAGAGANGGAGSIVLRYRAEL